MKCLRELIWMDILEGDVRMELSTPLVSVVIPCYNVEDYIEDCLKSIHNQTYLYKEVLLIDDGSTDNTLDKIQHFIDVYSGAGGGIPSF